MSQYHKRPNMTSLNVNKYELKKEPFAHKINLNKSMVAEHHNSSSMAVATGFNEKQSVIGIGSFGRKQNLNLK